MDPSSVVVVMVVMVVEAMAVAVAAAARLGPSSKSFGEDAGARPAAPLRSHHSLRRRSES